MLYENEQGHYDLHADDYNNRGIAMTPTELKEYIGDPMNGYAMRGYCDNESYCDTNEDYELNKTDGYIHF